MRGGGVNYKTGETEVRKREDQFTVKDVAKAIGIGIVIAVVILVLLGLALPAKAATVYVDRPVPVPLNKPCIVAIGDTVAINAAAVTRVLVIEAKPPLTHMTRFYFHVGYQDVHHNYLNHFTRWVEEKCK